MFRSYRAIVDKPGTSMPESLSKYYLSYHIVPGFFPSMFGARSYTCKNAKLFENRIATLERIGCKVDRKNSFARRSEDQTRANARAVLTWFR